MIRTFIILALALFVSSAHAQRFVKTFDTIDQMLAANPRDIHTNAFTLGRTASGDGGGGAFWYDANATTTTNLGTVFKPNSANGRWLRKWSGEPIDIQWFGAVPTKDVSGTLTPAGTFNNAPYINAAISFARTPTYGPTDVRASVFIPAGDWWISTPITNRYRVDVFGLGCVFSDNEFTSHGVSSSGLISGASRIRLADGANCPMMVWDISDASQRYTFSYTDDGLTMASTITIASPGVITSTNHGLTIGRRVGFTTTGSLPTGISPSTIYYVASVPTADTLTISATVGGAAIITTGSQSGTHTLIKDPTPKYVAGNTIRGINFFGNSVNQTKGDCHIIKIEYAWNIRLDNCNFGNPNGYMVWAYDCNTLDIVDCYGNGGSIRNKGVFLHSCADGFLSQNKFGGASGPALWIASTSGWQQQYLGNFLYNNFNGRFTVSSIVSDEVTFTANHDFETGMPIEFAVGSGGTLPTLTRYPAVATDSHVFWAIKTAANKIKVAYSYEDALGGTALAITGGSGTFYVWRGPGAGAYLSGGANNNILSGNRCDQNQNFGIALNKATENAITGNLLNLNGYDSLTATSETTTSAGVYLRNGSANNVVLGNSMMDWNTYAQTYGVWVDSNNGRNFIGQNAYKANPSQVDTFISTTGNTTETPIVQKNGGVTIYADSTGSPITIARSDTAGEWKFEMSSNTNIMRIKNSYVGNTALSISSPTTDVSLTLGSTASPLAPRNSLLYGEYASTLSGSDVAAGDFYVVVGAGTGTNASGGAFRVYTATTNSSSGTTVQSTSEKFKVMREGGIVIKQLTAAPTYGIADGAIYPNSVDSFFYGRLGSAWHTMSTPNKTGVQTISADASATFTFSPLVNRWMQVLTAPITAARTVTLSTSFAQQGTEATFIRSAASTGAFNWSIGGLVNLTPGTWATVIYDGSAWVLAQNYTGGGGGGLTDGDKGDITVSGSGSTLTIDNSAVTYAKMQNVSAVSKLLGRNSATTGPPEEITLGSGLTMSGTTLSVSAGGGNVSLSGTPVAGQAAEWATASTIQGVSTTGSGSYVKATSPTLTTPVLGVASATTVNKLTLTPPATGSTLTVADGKTLTANNTVTLSGTDGSTITFGGGGTVAYTANNLSVFGSTTSAQLAGVLSNETGTGLAVFNDGATITNSTLNGITFAGTAGSTLNIGTGGTLGTAAYTATGAYQAADSELAAIAGLTSAADRLPYFTGSGTAALATFTSAGRALVDDADASAQRTTLGLGTVATESTVPVAKGGTGATTASGALDALNVAETTVASATTTDLGAVASDKVSITGTTTITSFGTATAGVKREGRFTGALTLTHNATSLIIPGGASLTTAAGDRFGAYSLGSGNWVVTYYTKADGTAIVGGGGGAVATDSIWDASGDLVVGTGSNTAARLAPPAKLSGQFLYYGPSGVEWIHPSTHYTYHEDFLINTIPGNFTSLNLSGTAGGQTAETGAVGILSAGTGTASNTYRHHYLGGNNQFALGRGRTIIEWKIRLPNLSDATDTYTAYVGMYDHQTTPVDGAWFEYTHGVNSGNWQCKVANNSSTTTTANTSVAASTSWVTFTIDANAGATEVKFYIDGTLVGTETGANIPGSSRASNITYGIAKTAGTTNARSIYADYVDVYVKY